MARLLDGRVRFVLGAVLAASSGWVFVGAVGTAGAATSVPRVVLGHCTAKTNIPGTLACKSKSSDPTRSGSASSDTVKVTTTGRGTVLVGTYAKDPVGALSSSTGTYFGVALSVPNAFTAVTVKDCNLGGGTTLYWWSGTTWLPVALQPGSISSASITCVTDTLGAKSSPSLATMIKLSRETRYGAVVFGVK